MDVAGEREGGDLSIDAAGDDDRDLRFELELPLDQDGLIRRPTQPLERILEFVVGGEAQLTTAVVAAGGRLESEGQAEFICRRVQVVRGSYRAPGGHLDSGRFDEPALGESVLGDEEWHSAGSDRDTVREGVDDVDGDVLEFVGDDIAELA
ncbi:MAG: hypothetical protein WKF78_10235 [Candidatus Limnocylindrales bacterium]